MSQAKVDKYKEEKKNRAQIMKKEKRNRFIAKVLACVIGAAIIVWAGFSLYQNYKPVVKNTYSVDMAAIGEYMTGMNETEVAESEEVSEAVTEAVSEAGSEPATEEVSETETAAE